ncbi:MAG TPA: DUF2997 domain-containing protein [Armatimonadetes bacterium]|nr:DUF2997 domain-containing protein [Armatimonadota bacterium]
MAVKQEIEFVIRPDGRVEERVRGVKGPRCEMLTAAIERALGVVRERQHTAEYYAEASEEEPAAQQEGQS